MLNEDLCFCQILINYIYQQYDNINHRKLFLYELIRFKEEIMLNKKIYMILLLLTVSICAISTVSAADNVTDAVAVDDASFNDVSAVINDDASDEIDDMTNEVKADVKNEDKLASPQNDSALAVEESTEVLSASSASSSQYKINFTKPAFTFAAVKGAKITFTIDPCKNTNYNCYNFYIGLFKVDSNNKPTELLYKSSLQSSDSASDRQLATYSYTVPAKGLAPGKYALVAFNDDTSLTPMSATILTSTKVATNVKAYKAVTY